MSSVEPGHFFKEAAASFDLSLGFDLFHHAVGLRDFAV
jgi:hypothetical protein